MASGADIFRKPKNLINVIIAMALLFRLFFKNQKRYNLDVLQKIIECDILETREKAFV